jgi:ABC-type multidrug transport system ATPase subunit
MDKSLQMDSIRKLIGYCPKYDFLYEDLTVYEQFELFSVFKQGFINHPEIKQII